MFEVKVHRIVKRHYKSYYYIPEHHHDFFHFIYVLNGRGYIQIEKHYFHAIRGILFLVPIHERHSIYSIDNLINFEFKFLCDTFLSDFFTTLPVRYVKLDFYEENIIKDIISEGILHKDYYDQVIQLKLLELFISIIRKLRIHKSNPVSERIAWETNRKLLSGFGEDYLNTIVQYINTHLGEHISSHVLAKKVGYTLPYFCTQFKNAFGISPTRYVMLVRIERAKEMMLYSNDSIEIIAQMVGFKSLHYFSKVFKKLVGLSPMQYRMKSKDDLVFNILPESVFVPASKFEHSLQPLSQRWEPPYSQLILPS